MPAFPRSARVLWRSDRLLTKSAPNRLGRNRFGVIVPANLVKLAARRNLLKRRLLAAARTLPEADRDLLFIVRREMTWPEIRIELAGLKAKLQP